MFQWRGANTYRSLLKVFVWELVMDFVEERLLERSTSSESEEPNAVLVEVDFCTNEAVNPEWVDDEGVPEDFDGAAVVCASDEDDFPTRFGLQVEFPIFGEGSAWGSRLDSNGMALPGSGDVSQGSMPEARHPGVVESDPDLGLPASVEAFDVCLETGFVGSGKDWGDAEAQAKANDPADGIGVLSGAGEAVVVVELHEAGQPAGPPVFEQAIDDGFGGDRTFGPGGGETAVQGNSGQNGEMRTVENGETFDGVEVIQFASTSGDLGQIPAGGGRGTSDSFAAIEKSMTFEDTSDGSARRQGMEFPAQLAADRIGAEFSERAVVFELFACCEDPLLDGGGRASCLSGSTGTIVPVDAVEAFSACLSHPVLDGGQRHGEASGNRAHGLPAADCSNHVATICGREFFEPSGSPGIVLRASFSSLCMHCKSDGEGSRGPWGSGTPVGLRPPGSAPPSRTSPQHQNK